MRVIQLLLAIVIMIGASSLALAKTVRYELVIENKPMNMSGKKEVDFALTVNGGIPAPTLEFTEGDDAEILVRNKLSKEEASIHWHGILLPPEEDGVSYVNTPPLFPGKERLFKFKIRQSGTYWYHSHTAVQEQKGVYGALIIHPKKKTIQYDKDAVLVLSDWSDENADQIIKNLRKDGDFYLYKKDSMRSYLGAIKEGGLKSHLSNEWARMGGMDLSDVGYDAFLINGKKDSQLLTARPGERIRLRIINAAASSYFYVAMGIPMTVISADGVDVKPVQTNELIMGMAETYDILFIVPDNKNYELRATVQDVTGYASTWIGMGEKVSAPNKNQPAMYASMEHAGHGQSTDHSAHSQHSDHHDHQSAVQAPNVDHSNHANHNVVKTTQADQTDWSSQSGAMLKQNNSNRKLEPEGEVLSLLSVDELTAIESTALPKDAKVHELKLVLGGDMERYVWHINGKAIQQDRLIYINQGEIVRFIFQNDTMMHHPMHLHGHFFRVVNAQGDKSPLKHTVDVPPHGSRTIEFFANEPGQWMLHCHNLYHMKTGMARVVRYNDFKLTPEMAAYDHHDPHLHEHLYTHTQLRLASHMAGGQFRLMRTWDEVELDVKSADVEGKNFSYEKNWETEGDLVYRRWFSNFFNIFAGGTLYHEQGLGTAGVGYTLPMLIESKVSVNHEGRFRFDLEKKFHWTQNFYSDADFTWRPHWGGTRDTEFDISLMYGPSWYWSAGLMFTEKSTGIGAQVQF